MRASHERITGGMVKRGGIRASILCGTVFVIQLKKCLITDLPIKEGFKMDYYRDDWNDADQQVVDMQEVYTLENEVLDLRERVQDQETDEVFVLYHLMDLRDKHKGNAGLIASLDEIIKLHSKEVIQRAKLYTRRGDEWSYD